MADGARAAGDMLLGLVVFIPGEKKEPLGQKSWCVPKAERSMCTPHVSAPIALWRGGELRAGDLLLACACLCTHRWAWRGARRLESPETGLQQLVMTGLEGPLGMASVESLW